MGNATLTQVTKPPLWVPGRNPAAWDLWRGNVLYLPLWEGSGQQAWDVSPYPNTTSNWHASLEWAPCEWGTSLYWDDDYEFAVDDADGLDASTGVTVLTAVDSDDYEGVGNDLGHVVSKWDAYVLRYGNSNKVEASRGPWFTIEDGGVPKSAIAGRISANGPHVWVGTYDGLKVRIWEDGNELDNVTYLGDIDTAATDLYIGNYQAGGMEMAGWIACVGVWNRALSPGEIATLAADPFWMIRMPE